MEALRRKLVGEIIHYQHWLNYKIQQSTEVLYTVFQLAGIRVKINQLRDEMEGFVSAQEFDKAAEVKNKIAELDQEKCDLETEANSVNNFQTRIEKVREWYCQDTYSEVPVTRCQITTGTISV